MIATITFKKKLKSSILERKQKTSRNKIQDISRQARLGIWAEIQSPEVFKQQHQLPLQHNKLKVSDIPFHDNFGSLVEQD